MLHPAFLLAAAVNDDGWIELPAAGAGAAFSVTRAFFAPTVPARQLAGAVGGFAQCVAPAAEQAGDWRPLDMAFFARCLGLALGSVTPGLFAVRGVGAVGQSRGRLVHTDEAAEEGRLRVIQGAFLVHRAAYEGQPA